MNELSKHLKEINIEKWRIANCDHPFVLGLGDGSLKLDKFQYYLKQDYFFLINYCKVLSLAASKSSNENIDDFVNRIKAIKNEPFRILLGSAHQMGTARINPNPEYGVVDLDGKVHGLDNVYIVDASTFPRCSGVNPMISIQSMSHFLTSKI